MEIGAIPCIFMINKELTHKLFSFMLLLEVISKIIQKMAFDAIRKELQRVVCTCYLACPAVALCGGGKVTGACPAAALCEGGKTLPLTDRRRGRFDNFEEF